MSEIIYLDKVNEVYLGLDLTKSQAMELKEYLAFYASNYKYHPQFKAGFWDGRIFLFNTKEKLLPIGLLPKFIQFCSEYQYEYEFNFDLNEELGSSIDREFFDQFMDILFPLEGSIQPRYYQTEAIWKALSSKRGILQLPTGAGKSLTQYSIIKYLITANKKVLMVVPSVSLVEQMFSDFKEYGFENAENNCNLIYAGKKFDTDKDITISTWQSLFTKSPAFFKDFDALIIDETHLASGQSLQSIAKMCVNCEYRIGLTGTMPKDEASYNTIVSFLGPVAYQLGAKTLIDEGVLSKIKIKNLVLDYPDSMRTPRIDYQAEQKAIIDYTQRTPKVLDEILSNTPKGQNTLILVQRIEHLKAVRNYIVDNYQNYKVKEYYGDTDSVEKEKIRRSVDEPLVTLTFGFKTIDLLYNDDVLLTNGEIKKAHKITMNDDVSNKWINDRC